MRVVALDTSHADLPVHVRFDRARDGTRSRYPAFADQERENDGVEVGQSRELLERKLTSIGSARIRGLLPQPLLRIRVFSEMLQDLRKGNPGRVRPRKHE